LQDPADPLNHALIDPRPEWYFMFLFQLLKYFQGPWIPIGTVVIPTIAVLFLLGLPFYDRNWARRASRRPVAVVSMSGVMLVIIFLTWGGFGFPTPTFNTTSSVAVGPTSGPVSFKNDVEKIFQAHCAACHLNGNAFGGLSLASYAGLVKGGIVVPGPVFKSGDHQASVIWQITQPGPTPPWPGGNRMPLGGPYLAPSEIQTLANWIDQGAKNN
jgi:hypothetical protein